MSSVEHTGSAHVDAGFIRVSEARMQNFHGVAMTIRALQTCVVGTGQKKFIKKKKKVSSNHAAGNKSQTETWPRQHRLHTASEDGLSVKTPLSQTACTSMRAHYRSFQSTRKELVLISGSPAQQFSPNRVNEHCMHSTTFDFIILLQSGHFST